MKVGDYVIYKVEPNVDDLSGDVDINKSSHGRLFTNTILTVEGKAIIFKDADHLTIKGIFSIDNYFVLAYQK